MRPTVQKLAENIGGGKSNAPLLICITLFAIAGIYLYASNHNSTEHN